MLTTNEIKYILQKHTPKPVFYIIYIIWLKVILRVVNFYNSIRLYFFTKEMFKTFHHHNVTFDILLNPNNGTVDNEIYLHKVYEPYFLSIIKRELKEGDTFVDIGANIGQHSLFASACVGVNGKVISFEPIPRIYDQFLSSIKENIKNAREGYNNISVHNLGCGESDKTLNIYSNNKNMGGSSLINMGQSTSHTEIKIVKADSFLEKLKKIDFIKIDVEGYEYYALLGLQETIQKYKPKIFLEYSLDAYNYTAESPDRNHGKLILDLLFTHGYTVYDLEDNDKVLDTDSFDNYMQNKISQTNLLCKI